MSTVAEPRSPPVIGGVGGSGTRVYRAIAEAASRILAFLRSSDQAVAERASRLVKAPSSLGRWRVESPDQIAAVEDLIGEDLLRYGYKTLSVFGHPFSGSASNFER